MFGFELSLKITLIATKNLIKYYRKNYFSIKLINILEYVAFCLFL